MELGRLVHKGEKGYFPLFSFEYEREMKINTVVSLPMTQSTLPAWPELERTSNVSQ